MNKDGNNHRSILILLLDDIMSLCNINVSDNSLEIQHCEK